MEWISKPKGMIRFFITGTVLLLLMMSTPGLASAAEQSFSMSLRPSAEVVNPGDTLTLAVQIHNNGWPDAGEAEVAAFQATLEYDRSVLEFQSVDIPEGTMGDFRPDSGIVLGYGEGHVFQETFDCAVLTMKVSESATGDIPIALNQVILGKQDATELKVSAAGPLVLKVGGSEAAGSGTGSQGNGEAAEAESGARGDLSGSGQSNSDQSATSGQTGTVQKAQDRALSKGNGSVEERAGGTSSEETANGTTDESQDPAGKENAAGNGSGSLSADESVGSKGLDPTVAGAAGQEAGDENEGNPWLIAEVLLALAVIAGVAAGIMIYRKRKSFKK